MDRPCDDPDSLGRAHRFSSKPRFAIMGLASSPEFMN